MKEKKGLKIGDSTQHKGIPASNHWERKISNSEKNVDEAMRAFCPKKASERSQVYEKTNETDY